MVPARFRVHVALALAGLHALLVAFDVLPRYDALLFVPLAFVFARWTESLAPRARFAAHVAFFAMAGAAVYANQLTTGVEGRHALVGGIIPWSDAEGFLSNAWRAIHGLPFSTAVTRTATRPLYPMSLSLAIAASGGNVKVAIALYAAAAALLMGLVSSRLATRFGPRTAAVVLAVLTFYMRRYLFVIGTESLGVLAGLAAFTLFLVALERDHTSRATTALLGAAFLVLGLGTMARPGPLFMLPILVVWLARRGHDRSARTRWGVGVACAAGFAIAMAFNALVIAKAAERSGAAGGEFPPILYGAMHGEDYTYLGQTHPEVANLPQAERMRATAKLIVSEVRARPWLAFGFMQGGGAFVASPHGLMSLAFYDPDDSYFEGKAPFAQKLARFAQEVGVYRIANLLAMALFAVAFVVAVVWGAVRVVRKRDDDPVRIAATLVLVGAIVSACLTPPWITEAAQLQSTTLSFLALLAFTGPRERGMTTSSTDARSVVVSTRRVWLAPAAIVAWLLAAFVFCVTRKNDVPACTDGTWIAHEPSMLVTVKGSGERGYSLERLERNLRFVGKHNRELTRPIVTAARPGLGIEMGFDACAGRAAVLLDDAARFEATQRGWIKVPGTTIDNAKRIFMPAFEPASAVRF